MRVPRLSKWWLLAAPAPTLAVALATWPDPPPRYDARAIYQAVPIDCPEAEALAAVPVPPGVYGGSTQRLYEEVRTGDCCPDDPPPPPPTDHEWFFEEGRLTIRVDHTGRVTGKSLNPGGEIPDDSALARLKRAVGLE